MRKTVVTSDCQNARALVPAYLDGEVSETQASLLRQHLIDCQDCRTQAQDQRSLKGWFVPLSAAQGGSQEVPSGFAARVARRAFRR